MMNLIDLLKGKCDPVHLDKIAQLNNEVLNQHIAKFVELLKPASIYVCNDSDEDREYIRGKTIKDNEEKPLFLEGHTIHFDGPKDQARDKANTKYLLPPDTDLGSSLNSTSKEQGLKEVTDFLDGIMSGKEMYILFFCLGPTDSAFSIPCVQITDSSYVAHSEYMLYRKGYEQFKKIQGSDQFFKFVHSAGELEGAVSKNVDKRRVYIDLDDRIVYSTNTQYAGNTVGLKKLALRHAINKASKEGWLAEHMMVTGIHGPDQRKSYFAGAFPSACGKTSTAMLPGETIIGDDIAYLRKIDGKVHAANVECGIFGIIRDVNAKDDPVIWDVLNKPGEVIVSNILIDENNQPHWLGDGRPEPEKGINYQGQWTQDKKTADGQEIPFAHKNARYTVSLYALKNMDSKLDDPKGVELKGIIYGGRDSSIWPPVQQAFDWAHGVITMGASLESETTAATLGQEGVRAFSPMANIDFVSIPLGKYIENYIEFAKEVQELPSIFAVNYFLKSDDGKYLTGMDAKRVWIKWMELRANGDVEAIQTPTGFIPKYEDLQKLFKDVLNKDYTHEEYNQQFTLKIPSNLEKIERIKEIYSTKVTDTPQILFEVLDAQKNRLEKAKAANGDYIAPEKLAGV